jgi:hypothetical protein
MEMAYAVNFISLFVLLILMKKSGQLMGQPLIMIFAAIVGVMILVWGGFQISKLVQFGSEVQLTKFVEDIRKEVQRYYYLDVGSSKTIKLDMPSQIKHMCVVNRNDDGTLNGNCYAGDVDGLNCALIEGNTESNVFFIPHDAAKKAMFKVDNLEKIGDTNPECFRNSEEIVLTTKASHVEISHKSQPTELQRSAPPPQPAQPDSGNVDTPGLGLR